MRIAARRRGMAVGLAVGATAAAAASHSAKSSAQAQQKQTTTTTTVYVPVQPQQPQQQHGGQKPPNQQQPQQAPNAYPQYPGYPPAGYPPAGYPPQQGYPGYPPGQYPSYPPGPGAYPPPPAGYPAAPGQYPPPGQGYPPASGQAPGQYPPPAPGPGYPPASGQAAPGQYPPPGQGYPPGPGPAGYYPPAPAPQQCGGPPPPYQELQPVAAHQQYAAPDEKHCGQKFEKRYFALVNESNCHVLEIPRDKAKPGASLSVEKAKHDKPAHQMWYLDKDGFIRSKIDDMSLVVKDKGDKVRVTQFTGDARQQWIIQGNKIVNRVSSNECIGLEKGLLMVHDDADIISSEYEGKPYQHWRIDYA